MRRRLARAVLVAAAALVASSGPVAAVDPIVGTPIPEEPPHTILGDSVTAARSFDLDGDGVREVVAIGAREDAGGLAGLRAWWVADDGSAEPSSEVRLRRSASVDELLSGRGRLGIDRDDMIAVGLGEPASLFVAQRNGADVLLLAAMGTGNEFENACCVTVWEVVLDGPQTVDLRLVAETMRGGFELVVVDLDGDGTDELFITEESDEGAGGVRLAVSVLRWNGDGFTRTAATFPVEPFGPILDTGESDGIAGEEVLLMSFTQLGEATVLRISLRGNVPHLEQADLGEVQAARVVDLEAGPAIVASDGSSSTLGLWLWPRDGVPLTPASWTTFGTPMAVFGRGADARIFVANGAPPGGLLVLPGDLGSGAGPSTTVGRDTRAGVFSGTALDSVDVPLPYFGVLRDGLPGAPDAYVFSGSLVAPDPDPVDLATSGTVALLAGLEPVGRVGPDGAWMGLLSEFQGLFGFASPDRRIGLFDVRPPGVLSLVATSAVVEPEADLGHLNPTFLGMTSDPARPGSLLVGSEAADAEITAPPGTTLWWVIRGETGSLEVPLSGELRIRLLEPAGPDAADGTGTTVSIRAITPAGHAYSGTWRIRVYRQPPDLGLREAPALLEFNQTLSGQTAPGSTVTINGNAVAVGPDGSFEMPVDVGILPTELRVIATDPLGNRTERVVTRVWPLDYRRLPFVPMVVVVTVAVALVQFLRKPDTGPRTRTPDDGSTFEEIGG